MKKLLLTCLTLLSFVTAFAFDGIKTVSGIYAGGHIRRGRPGTYTKLRQSGFTYIILFNINVEEDGTLTTDGETVCKNGEYVFDKTQPDYAADVASLKAPGSGFQRVEICIGGWGNKSYGNIKKLIGSASSITSTNILYKNFRALKKAVPEIDAVNNDQEQDYDVDAAVKFHVMMSKLGYKTSIAPYTNLSYWRNFVTNLNNQRANACDQVMVQCYDGGAGNNPKDWHINNITLHAGLLDYSNDWSVERNLAHMQKWHDECQVEGGFVWLFNDGYDENWDMYGWATGMNRIFGSVAIESKDTAAVVYEASSFRGYPVALPAGRYRGKGGLGACGIKTSATGSLKVTPGYVVYLYKSETCTGTSSTKKADAKSLSTFANNINSIIILTEKEAANADSLKSNNTAMNTNWKALKKTIAESYASMLEQPDFLERYNALHAAVAELYPEVNALDPYDRAKQFSALISRVNKLLKDIETLLDEVTAIDGIADNAAVKNQIISLDGRVLPAATKRGVYIINGKKVLR